MPYSFKEQHESHFYNWQTHHTSNPEHQEFMKVNQDRLHIFLDGKEYTARGIRRCTTGTVGKIIQLVFGGDGHPLADKGEIVEKTTFGQVDVRLGEIISHAS